MFDAYMKEVMKQNVNFNNIQSSQNCLEKWVQVIDQIQENSSLNDQCKIRQDFIDGKKVKYYYEPGKIGIQSTVLE